MKEKILKSCNGIPPKNLANYLKQGIVTLPELKAAGLRADKVAELNQLFVANEKEAWDKARKTDTAAAYTEFINVYPESKYADEARTSLDFLDDRDWQIASNNMTAEALQNYKNSHIEGKHLAECETFLEDLPWMEACKKNTIYDYQLYMQQYPNRHDAEAADAINVLNDESDWSSACITNTSAGYRWYLDSHPNGTHVDEADFRIQSSAGRDNFIQAIREDKNAFSAEVIQENVNNGVVTWEDIESVFGHEKTNAIREYRDQPELPSNIPSPSLQPDSTEVYFWGTPSSGKTCALGSIISAANREGIFEPLDCTGNDYMNRLANIFKNNGICVFPPSTDISNIQEMVMNLRDDKNKNHKLSLIDLAGELFRSVYFKQNNNLISDENAQTLQTAMNYLQNNNNPKIHFFVIEYGAHNKEWDGLSMNNYLNAMVNYLKDKKILSKLTVGVYILVTKTDLIDCPPEERPRKAFEYVKEEMASFYNTMELTCKNAGISDFKVLSFSVGDVFAQQLCLFDKHDTSKVISRLLTKTRPEKGGFLSWLKS